MSPDDAREVRTMNDAKPSQSQAETSSEKPRKWKFLKNYPHEFIIGDSSHGVTTISSSKKAEISNVAFLSQLEPQNVKQDLEDPSWAKAM